MKKKLKIIFLVVAAIGVFWMGRMALDALSMRFPEHSYAIGKIMLIVVVVIVVYFVMRPIFEIFNSTKKE